MPHLDLGKPYAKHPLGPLQSQRPCLGLGLLTLHQGLEERMTTSLGRLLGSLGKADLEEAFGGISCGLP